LTESPIFGADDTQFAGVSASNINLQRDGVTVNDVRFGTGLNSPVYLNPEMVGEFKMVLAPVDAEMGRGNGQVQVITRSGANTFHGSAVWNNQNTALDAMEWTDNLRQVPKDFRNQNEYTLSLGGPIIKNKTFFFVSWDHQFSVIRQNNVNLTVLTPCARKSIFRYFDGWSNGNILTVTNTTSGFASTPITPVVNADGSPKTGLMMPGSTTTASNLHNLSVLGPLLQTPNNDCSNVTLDSFGKPTSDWVDYSHPYDTNRTFDATGYMKQSIDYLPLPNNYQAGDGLNYGGFRWVRHLDGGDNIYGLGEGPNRRQINFRIDHNFSARHRISGAYSYERDNGEDAFPQLPDNNVNGTGGFGGLLLRRPQNFSINFTSTLKPTLLNEFRFGMTRTASYTYNPLDNPETGKKLAAKMNSMYPTGSSVPVIIGIGNPGFAIAGGVNVFGSGRGNMAATWGGHDPRWTYGDTVTWTRGKHSMKFGAEVQRTQSYQTIDGVVSFGAGALAQPAVQGSTIWTGYGANAGLGYSFFGFIYPNSYPGGNMPGAVGSSFAGNILSGAYNLMNIQAGAISSIDQWRFITKPTDLTYNDISKGQNQRIIDYRQNQFNFFVKDDWKITDRFTVNLGIRYEWYGVPYLKGGLTAGLKGGAASIFGRSGRSFADWMKPGAMNTDGTVTYKGTDAELAFIGPDSPNPNQKVWNNDWNNFGPAVGFAWQLPWFGEGKTTIRGGYQVTYMPPGRADSAINYMPGFSYQASYTPNSTVNYLNLSNLRNFLPVVPIPSYVQTPAANPVLSVRQRSQSLTVYDPNLRNPYIQNLTMSLTRNLGTNWTLDLRYIGTLSRKQTGTINLNSANIWNNGLKEAFDAARYGNDSSPALNVLYQMFKGINIAGTGYTPVDSPQAAAKQLRAFSSTSSNLANGNYIGLAGTLATMNYVTSNPGNSGLPAIGPDESGTVLRYNKFPENFISTSPQFSSANWTGNINHANYHSMQAQITLRPTHGLSFSGTYTWSRNLGMLSTTDVRNRALDYGLNGMNRTHQIAVNGNYELPFGPNGYLFKNAGGVVSRIVSGWQLGWIANFATGRPFGISASTSTLYGAGVPNRVGDFDTKSGYVHWTPGSRTGSYWWDSTINDSKYTLVPDPQCRVTSSEFINPTFGTNACSLQALALTSSLDVNSTTGKHSVVGSNTKYIFVNPYPTERGNFQQNILTMPAVWSADMTMGKSIRITEGKTLQFRVDATNIFNHQQPTAGSWQSGTVRVRVPGAPVASLAGQFDFATFTTINRPLGYLDAKVGARTFQAKIRFDF